MEFTRLATALFLGVSSVSAQANLRPTGMASSTPTAMQQGGTYTPRPLIQNAGTQGATGWSVRVYLSSDQFLSTSTDYLFGQGNGPGLAPPNTAGVPVTSTLSATLPPGTYYYIVWADPTNAVVEGAEGETDNVAAYSTVTVTARPDIWPVLWNASNQVNSPGTISFTLDLADRTSPAIGGTINSRVYLSQDQNLSRSADLFLGNVSHNNIGSNPRQTGTLPIPSGLPTGTWHAVACADDPNVIAERTETDQDNCLADPLSITLTRPDVTMSITSVPGQLDPGASASVGVTILNKPGNTTFPASATYTRSDIELRLSTDVAWSSSDIPVQSGVGCGTSSLIQPGQSVTPPCSMTIPSGVAPGLYFVLGMVDPPNRLSEWNESDNGAQFANRIQVGVLPGSVSVTVFNPDGTGVGSGWSVELFSGTTRLATGATTVQSMALFNPVAPGTGYSVRVSSSAAAGSEFWGSHDNLAIQSSTTTTVMFTRREPFVQRVEWLTRHPLVTDWLVLADGGTEAYPATPNIAANGSQFALRLHLYNPSSQQRQVTIVGTVIITDSGDTARLEAVAVLPPTTSVPVQADLGDAYKGLRDNFGGWPAVGTSGEGRVRFGIHDASTSVAQPFDTTSTGFGVRFAQNCSSRYTLTEVTAPTPRVGESGRDVILIHGYDSFGPVNAPTTCPQQEDTDPNNYFALDLAPDDFRDTHEWPEILQALHVQGTQVWVYRWPTYQSMRGAADWLQREIRARSEIGNDIILVGHSMGGIVATEALVNNGGLRDRLSRVITLGSPHNGSDQLLGRAGGGFSANEMMSEAFTNRRRRQFRTTDFAKLRIAGGSADLVVEDNCAYDRVASCTPPSLADGVSPIPIESYLVDAASSTDVANGSFHGFMHCHLKLANMLCWDLIVPLHAPAGRLGENRRRPGGELADAVRSLVTTGLPLAVATLAPVSVSSTSVFAGQPLDITIAGTNTGPGSTNLMGYMSLGMPGLTAPTDEAQILEAPADGTILQVPRSQTLYDVNGTQREANYLLVEYQLSSWGPQRTNALRVRVVPRTPGTFVIEAKLALEQIPGTFSRFPTQQNCQELLDQQNICVTRTFVTVLSPPVALAMTTQPGAAVSGERIGIAPIVELRDAQNQPVLLGGVSMTATKASGPGSLSGTLSATTSTQGRATFGNLILNGAGEHAIRFSAPDVTPINTQVFSVALAPARGLAMITEPGGAVSGLALGTLPVVELRNALDEPVLQSGAQVTAAIRSGTGTLGGILTASTNSQGRAAFTNLSITGFGGHELRFTSPNLNSVASQTFTVVSAPATHLAVVTQPAGAGWNQAFGTPPVVELRDSQNQPVFQSGVTLTAIIATGNGALSPQPATASTNEQGRATFSSLAITGTGAFSLDFIGQGLQTATSEPFVLSPPAQAELVVDGMRVNPAGPVIGQPATVYATVHNLGGSEATGVPWYLFFNGTPIGSTLQAQQVGGGTIPSIPPGGIVEVSVPNVMFDVVGNYTSYLVVDAEDHVTEVDETNDVASLMISVAGSLTERLTVLTEPAGAATGQLFANQPVVQLVDAQSQPVLQSNVPVTARVVAGTGTLSPQPSMSFTDSQGRATFTNLAISGTGQHALEFTAPNVTRARSQPFHVSGPLVITTPSHLPAGFRGVDYPWPLTAAGGTGSYVWAVTSGTLPPGIALSANTGVFSGFPSVLGTYAFTVSAQSGRENARTDFDLTILDPATIASDSLLPTASTGSRYLNRLRGAGGNGTYDWIFAGGGTLPPGLSISSTGIVSGVPSVPGSYAFTVSIASAGYGLGKWLGLNVVEVPATHLAVVTQPSGAVSHQPFEIQPVIELRNAENEPVLQGGIVVTVAKALGPGVLSGTVMASTDAQGRAVFENLAIAGNGTHTLEFTTPLLTGVNSQSIHVSLAPATHLALVSAPGGAVSGQAFGSQPVLELRDGSNRLVPQGSVIVTAVKASGSGSLGGTVTVMTDGEGRAAFADLLISGSGTHTLQFSSAGLTGVSSQNILVSLAPATQLALVTEPDGAVSGQRFGTQPVIELRDAVNKPVLQPGVLVTVTKELGQGILGGTVTATTDEAGRAFFTDLTIIGSEMHRLSFSATGLIGLVSQTFSVSRGPSTQLTVIIEPAGAVSGQPFVTSAVVGLRDVENQAVLESGVVVTARRATGAGGLAGAVTATTDATGRATFDGLLIAGTGAHALAFSAPNLTEATSATFAVAPSLATHLAVATAPGGAISGLPFTSPPVIELRDEQNLPVLESGVTVSATALGPGSLSGGLSAATDGQGRARFLDLVITGDGSHTLVFTAPGLTGVVPLSFDVARAAATHLALVVEPEQAVSGQAFGSQPVVELRDGQGQSVTQGGVDITVTKAAGTGTLGGTLVATTDAQGRATYSDLSITGLTDHALEFNAAGLTGALSQTLTVLPAPGARLAVAVEPDAATSGQPFGMQPVIELRDAQNQPALQSGIVVTTEVASGHGTLGGTVSATTDGQGHATFGNLTITGSEAHSLRFAAPGLIGASSRPFPVLAPLIVLGTPTLTFTAVTGGPAPLAQSVSITNGGVTGTLLTGLVAGTPVYETGQLTGWVSELNLSSTSAPAVLTVRPTTGDLTPGTFSARIPVDAVVSSNSPQSISIAFLVTSPPGKDVVVAELLRSGNNLTVSERLYLDYYGNRDGSFNLGDVVALFDRLGSSGNGPNAQRSVSAPARASSPNPKQRDKDGRSNGTKGGRR